MPITPKSVDVSERVPGTGSVRCKDALTLRTVPVTKQEFDNDILKSCQTQFTMWFQFENSERHICALEREVQDSYAFLDKTPESYKCHCLLQIHVSMMVEIYYIQLSDLIIVNHILLPETILEFVLLKLPLLV